MSTTRGSFRFHLFLHVFQIGWDAGREQGRIQKRQKLSLGKKLIRLVLHGIMD